MQAHVEILAFVVRVGPDCDAYGRPFEFAVAGSSIDGKTAFLKALVAKGDFTQTHAKAIIRALKREIKPFLFVAWDGDLRKAPA